MRRSPLEIRGKIELLTDLPPLPEVARKILALRASPQQDARALAAIIELDPSLSTQVLRYARSSLYGYKGKLQSTEDAIARVLGYELVLNLALALAATKPFIIPHNGPFGSAQYWSRSVQCAVIAQTLAYGVPSTANCRPSLAYLTGLLHDFGLLVLAHLCPNEYGELNLIMTEEPNTPLEGIEIQLFGMTHGEAGARALRSWDLPDELIITSLKARDNHYRGMFEVFPHLVNLANHLLMHGGNVDETDGTYPQASMEILRLESSALQTIAAKVALATGAIDSMLNRVAA
jgi:HD-like signal output (HDOD) protein